MICYKGDVKKESSVAKTKTAFYCTDFGSELTKWAGQCPDCKAWNTVKEFRQAAAAGAPRTAGFAARRGVTAYPLAWRSMATPCTLGSWARTATARRE